MLFCVLSEHHVSRAFHSQCYLACCQNTIYQGPPTPIVILCAVRTSCIKGLPLPVLFSLLSEHHVSRAFHSQCYLACCQNTMYQGPPTPSVILCAVKTPCIKGLPLPVLFSLLSEHHVLRVFHSQCYLACCQSTMY